MKKEVAYFQLIEGNGYEARQRSLLYVFLSFSGLGRTQTQQSFTFD